MIGFKVIRSTFRRQRRGGMTAAGRATALPRDALLLFLALVIAAALLFRVLWLDSVPGLNGDEAWYGVWALRCVQQGVCSLQTPAANPTNPFYMAIVVALQAVLPPSMTVLRGPAVLCGIALPVIGYLLLRRPLGRQPAAAFAVLAATLPVDIAYSRFGWDAAEIALAATLVLGLAVRGNWILALLAWGASLLVHPTDIFLLPMLASAALSEPLRPLLRSMGRRRCLVLIATALLIALSLAWLLSGTVTVGPEQWRGWHLIARFFPAFVELLSGNSIYEYIVGNGSSFPADVVAGAALLAVGAILLWEMLWRPWSRESILFAGFLAMLAGYAGVAGPGALAPGWERYGIVLVAPVLLQGALAIRSVFGPEGRAGLWVAGAIGLISLAGFGTGYMLPLTTGGGRAADPATVAQVEPKLQAAAILRGWAGGESRVIAADDWWTFEPLVYFLWPTPSLRVVRMSTAGAADADYAATLPGSDGDRYLAALHQPTTVIRDLAGRPALDLWRLRQ